MTFQVDKQPFQTIKTSIYKVKKFAFFKRGYSMVFVKNCNFSHLFFLVKISQRKVFGPVLHREISFLDDKNIDQKKGVKFAFFQRGPIKISPWFFSKIVIFVIRFFYSRKGEQKRFMALQIDKQPLQTIKTSI